MKYYGIRSQTAFRNDADTLGILSCTTGSTAIAGYASTNVGVYGSSSTCQGVRGNANTCEGVYGYAPAKGVSGTATNYGVYGCASSLYGVYGCANCGGIHGRASTACGVYGHAVCYGIYAVATCEPGIYTTAPRCALVAYSPTSYAIIACSPYTTAILCSTGTTALAARSCSDTITSFSACCNAIKSSACCHYAICGHSYGHSALWGKSASCTVIACSCLGSCALIGKSRCTTALSACAYGSFGIYACTRCQWGIYGHAVVSIAVAGNGAYFNASSSNLKYKRPVCITKCLKAKPLPIYKYTWEDSNMLGFDEFIGPVSEDYIDTFNTTHQPEGDEAYESMPQLGGIALGLAQENMNRIEVIKNTFKLLVTCINKLEEEVKNGTSR